MKEWKGLWGQEVFDFFLQTREYDDVVSEGKKKGEEIHMAHVRGLIYEKNCQLKEDNRTQVQRARSTTRRSGQRPKHGSCAVPGIGQLTGNL